MKIILVLLALNLAVSCVAAPPQPQGENQVTTPAASALASPTILTTEGTISMAEPDGTIVVVAGGKSIALRVRPETKVVRNEVPASINELKVGDRVIARHTMGGAALEVHAQGR